MSIELEDALLQISAIRHQMARSEQFRGYRAAPVAASGLIAFAAGALQPLLIVSGAHSLNRYLGLWVTVAAVSMVVCFGDVWRRYRLSPGMLIRESTHLAIGQFCPCIVAGALITAVIVRSLPEAAGMLPGLWGILFSLGLFASWRLLPRAIFGVACYYLVGGLYALSFSDTRWALSSWTMPLLFGTGQLLTAAVLYFSERECARLGDET